MKDSTSTPAAALCPPPSPLPSATGSGGPMELRESPAAVSPGDSLGSKVLKGATWIVIQSIVAQVLALLSRIIIYRRVDPHQIATAMYAMGACSFLGWLQPALVEILVQRKRHFKAWGTVAFWITAAAGGLALLAGVIVGPVLGYLNRNQYPPFEVAALVMVTTVSMALTSLAVTYTAEQTIHFQFRRLAVIGTAGSIATAVLMIAMAFLKMGSWTLVVPATVANGVVLVMLACSGKFRPEGLSHARPRRTGAMLRMGMLLTGTGFFSNLCLQADNFFVGQFRGEDLAAYAAAYSMSFAFVQLASRGVRGTFLTAFTSMNAANNQDGDARYQAAYVESLKLVALVIMPASILPIPAAHWAVALVFGDKWSPAMLETAVPMFRIFLLGMGFVIFAAIAQTIWYARGWYKILFVSSLVTGVLFCALVGPTAAFFPVKYVAALVTAIYAVSSLVLAVMAAAPCPAATKWRVVWSGILPFALSCAAAGGAFWLVRLLGLDLHGFIGAVASLFAGAAVFALLALLLMRPTVRTAWMRLGHLRLHRKQPVVSEKAPAAGPT